MQPTPDQLEMLKRYIRETFNDLPSEGKIALTTVQVWARAFVRHVVSDVNLGHGYGGVIHALVAEPVPKCRSHGRGAAADDRPRNTNCRPARR